MILLKGERLIVHGWAYLVEGDATTQGLLYLSNFRVVFEAGAGGPNPYTAIDLGVEHVYNVHAGKNSGLLARTREFLTIEGRGGRAVLEVAGAPAWARAIAEAKQSLPPRPPPPAVQPSAPSPPGYGGHAPVVVNIPAPVAPQIMMHCRYCGNLFDATNGRCDKCGARPT